MTWEQAITAFAGVAFLWIWKQLHEEVSALRKWRHGLDGALPVLEGAMRTLESRVTANEKEIERMRPVVHRVDAEVRLAHEKIDDVDTRVGKLERWREDQ